MGQGDQSTRPPQPNLSVVRDPRLPLASSHLYKHKSWSPDIVRDQEWEKRRKGNHGRNKSVTEEDIDELKACFELGFGFDEADDRLSKTLPALSLYYAVNKQYQHTVSKSSSISSSSSFDSDLFGPGDDTQTMKTRLKQWAQVVACSLRQSSSFPSKTKIS